jgi:hypothetical protein
MMPLEITFVKSLQVQPQLEDNEIYDFVNHSNIIVLRPRVSSMKYLDKGFNNRVVS